MKASTLAKVAVHAVPEIVKNLGPSGESFAGPICDAIKTYGCRNQIAIVEAVKAAVPEFCKYSDTFLQLFSEVVTVAERSSSKDYELIVEAVLDSQMGIEQKVEYVVFIERERAENRNSMVKGILGSAGKMILMGGGCLIANTMTKELGSVLKTYIKEQGKTSRSLAANLLKNRK